jgi:hypothetical protein
MLYPWVTRYPPDTQRARGRVRNFTHGHGDGQEILPATHVRAGMGMLYPPRTRPIAIPIQDFDHSPFCLGIYMILSIEIYSFSYDEILLMHQSLKIHKKMKKNRA